MRAYLSTIHTRSHAHKKRFAFGVSAGITLSIFAIWSIVTFSSFGKDSVVATDNRLDDTAAPIENIKSGVASSFQALKDQMNSVKGSVKAVDLNKEYQDVRNDAVNQNGY